MTVLKLVPKIVWVGLIAALIGLAVVPNIARAEDGCGLMGYVFGCDLDQQNAAGQAQYDLNQQQLANEAEKQAYDAKVAFEQIAAERDKAAAAAATEQDRIRIQGEAEQARVRAQLESDKLNALVSERMNQVNAAATVNLAAMQADTVKHLADQQVVVESNRTDALVYIAVIVALGVGGWGWYVWNKQREVEVKAKLLQILGPEQLRIAAQMENNGIPWEPSKAGQVMVQHPTTGQWVIAKS